MAMHSSNDGSELPDLISPLRYPGSKRGLADYFSSFIKENLLAGTHLYELYAGGASISLSMLARQLVSRVTLVEKDPLIYSFWKCVKNDPERLCKKIKDVPVTLATWRKFQRYLSEDALEKFSVTELGLAGLFLNRSSFSGVINAGPIGGMDQSSEYDVSCRFNKDRIIERIEKISEFSSKMSVVYSDAIQYLNRHSAKLTKSYSLVYLDPPYYKQGKKLYRYHYKTDQHKALADTITKEKMPWIISYDNHPVIRKLFAGQKIMPITLNYVVKQSRKADELLISNVKLIRPIYQLQDSCIGKRASMERRHAL